MVQRLDAINDLSPRGKNLTGSSLNISAYSKERKSYGFPEMCLGIWEWGKYLTAINKYTRNNNNYYYYYKLIIILNIYFPIKISYTTAHVY